MRFHKLAKSIGLSLACALIEMGCLGPSTQLNQQPTPDPMPTPAAYTVEVMVTGLNGTLVLQNNGGDDLTITENGSFSFKIPVLDKKPYEVTIQSKPGFQTCTLGNSTGTGEQSKGSPVVTVACVTPSIKN